MKSSSSTQQEKMLKRFLKISKSRRNKKKALAKSTGEGLNSNELIVLMDWFTPLLRIVCSKVVKESDFKWVPMKGRNNVKLLFVHDPQGFTSCGSILKKALPHQKIDVLIADSDYGIKEEPWDKVAWTKEFEQALNFVYTRNQTLRECNFFFFL